MGARRRGGAAVLSPAEGGPGPPRGAGLSSAPRFAAGVGDKGAERSGAALGPGVGYGGGVLSPAGSPRARSPVTRPRRRSLFPGSGGCPCRSSGRCRGAGSGGELRSAPLPPASRTTPAPAAGTSRAGSPPAAPPVPGWVPRPSRAGPRGGSELGAASRACSFTLSFVPAVRRSPPPGFRSSPGSLPLPSHALPRRGAAWFHPRDMPKRPRLAFARLPGRGHPRCEGGHWGTHPRVCLC